MYSIATEFGIPTKLGRLIKMYLSEISSRVRLGRHLFHVFHIKKGLKQSPLLPLLFNCALEYAIRRVQVNQYGLKLNGTHQLPVPADNVNILGGNVHTMKKNTEALVFGSKETRIEVNAGKLSTWSYLEIRMQKEFTI